MEYIQLDADGRVIAHAAYDENPDPEVWLESPWEAVPDDFDDWLYIDGQLVNDPRNLPPAPLDAGEVLTAIFAATPEAIQALPDESLARMAPYMQDWEADADYRAGDLRSYGGLPYRCLQTHKSQATWNPADAPSLWARVLIPDPSVIPEWEQPGSTNPYMKGDKVRHNGKIWASDIDNNVWEPGVYGWTEVV